MYYTDGSILPENMALLIITAAPFGPQWLPGDADIPVTCDEQVQTAVDCYNAGATMLHVHVRDPATGHGSVDFEQYNSFIRRLRQAVPKMILQVCGAPDHRSADRGRRAPVPGVRAQGRDGGRSARDHEDRRLVRQPD